MGGRSGYLSVFVGRADPLQASSDNEPDYGTFTQSPGENGDGADSDAASSDAASNTIAATDNRSASSSPVPQIHAPANKET